MSIMMFLMILLFIEYRFFCSQVSQLFILKQQYASYIKLLHKKTVAESIDRAKMDEVEDMIEDSPLLMDEIIAAESSDAPDNDDEYAEDSFVIINRHPDYLKQSTLDYMESQEMNALMTAIDIDRWSDYTELYPVEAKKLDGTREVGRKKTVLPSKNSKSISSQNAQSIIASRRPLKECGFIWPIDLDKFWLSSLFGPRKRIDGTWGFHHGIDMAAIKGTKIKAVKAGIVEQASFQSGYGNTVVIKHGENIKTRYAHLHTIEAYVGQKVKQASIVGTVGETGSVRKKGKDGSHLHFEVYEHNKRINPLHCLPRMT